MGTEGSAICVNPPGHGSQASTLPHLTGLEAYAQTMFSRPLWCICKNGFCCLYTHSGCIGRCSAAECAIPNRVPADEYRSKAISTCTSTLVEASVLGGNEEPVIYASVALGCIPGGLLCLDAECSYAVIEGRLHVYYSVRAGKRVEVSAIYGSENVPLPRPLLCGDACYEIMLTRQQLLLGEYSSSDEILTLALRGECNQCLPLLVVRVGAIKDHIQGSLAIRIPHRWDVVVSTRPDVGESRLHGSLLQGNVNEMCLSCRRCIIVKTHTVSIIRSGNVCIDSDLAELAKIRAVLDVDTGDRVTSVELMKRVAKSLVLRAAIAALKLAELAEHELSDLAERRKLSNYAAILDNLL